MSSPIDDFLLHQTCASPNTTFDTVYEICQSHPRSRRIIDQQSWLPLHHALLNTSCPDQFLIVEYLLEIYEEGARRRVEHGRTCLHLAVRKRCSPNIVAMLLNVWPEAAVQVTKILEQTPLHYSCRYGASIDVVRILTNANRHLLKQEDGAGRLPLHVALRNRCAQNVINCIIRKDPTACTVADKCGFYPAAVAVLATNRLPALRLVLQTWEGVLLTTTRDGDSLMHIACRASSPPVLKYLLHIGISTNLKNHKGCLPMQCLPRRPRKSDPSTATLGVDRKTIMDCLVQITKARRSWNPQTHQLFPPDFRAAAKILALFSLRFEQTHVVLEDGRLRLPFQNILKFLGRTWFDTKERLERLQQLQPHLVLGEFGQVPSYDSLVGIKMDVFANRRKRRKLIMKIRTMSSKMNANIFRIATKRVVVGLKTSEDKTGEVIAHMDAVRQAKQEKIDRAKKMAKARKDAARMKQMAAFMRERTGENLAHPLDLMNNEAKEEEERIQAQQNGLLPPEAKVLGRPWYEFLRQSNGVNELFYEQLLRENVRMEKEFMHGIHELHAFDNENAMIGSVLEDAEYQLEVDQRDVEQIFGTAEEYIQEVEEEKLEQIEEEKDRVWGDFVRRVGGAKEFDFADHVNEQGSPKIVSKHMERKKEHNLQEEKRLQEAWDGVDSEMSEEEVLLRMMGIVGDEENEWNDDYNWAKETAAGGNADDGWEWEGEDEYYMDSEGKRK